MGLFRRAGRSRGVEASAAAILAGLLAGCGSSGPVARNAQDCLAAVGAVIRSAPPSASDPSTGNWLGRVDRLRGLARTFKAVTSRQLAGELDWAGARVALDHYPPQLAIVPAQDTCTASDLDSASAPASAVPAAHAWLRADPPPARAGMTAGIITKVAEAWLACPSPVHSYGSEAVVGNGCPAWSVTLATAAGTLRASCGDIGGGAICTSATAKDPYREYDPGIGDELYVPDSGQVTAADDITIISQPPWDNWQAGVAALIKAASVPGASAR